MTKSVLLPNRRPFDKDQNLISLINIVFLLLIFFMIVGKLNQSRLESVELPVLQSLGTATQERVQIQIRVDGATYMDGEPVTQQQIKQYIDESKLNSEIALDIQADQALTAGRLDQLLSLMRAAGIHRIKLYTRNKRDL